MKVAIVHDYLSDFGGAEKVVNAIYEIYPTADIYTAVKNEKKLKSVNAFIGAKIYAPRLNGLIGLFKKLFVFSYPAYFENLNLQKYDLVISSTAHFAKGIITNSNSLHVCYIHTPPRFLWGLKTETSFARDNLLLKPILVLFDSFLRVWDFVAAQRPDYLLTNSINTKRRISKFYKRDSTVIYPFYDFNLNKQEVSKIKPVEGDFYFTISRKGKFKNIDLIAKTFKRLKKVIYIAGECSKDKAVQAYAGKYVKLIGFLSEEEKISYLKGCKAFVVATENEDFGITPIEAMSFGKPIIAYKSGGYVETVKSKKTGILFKYPKYKSLKKAILKFEKTKFNEEEIVEFANKFSKENFQKQFKDFVSEKMKETELIENLEIKH
ncbi:glycosyltransferase [Patescibacteria group bacterium]|nr:glycosyltransferase [Patescibacteria group bacterium]